MTDRLKAVTGDLSVADEQLAHFVDEADEARLRALVSETPGADRASHDAQRHVEAMRRHRDQLLTDLGHLETSQNELLDRLVAAGA